MENQAVHNAYSQVNNPNLGADSGSNVGQGDPSNTVDNLSLLEIEQGIYNFALDHEYEQLTQDGHWVKSDTPNQAMEELANDAGEEISALKSASNGSSSQNALSLLQADYNEQMNDLSQMKIISDLQQDLSNAVSYDKANENSYYHSWSWLSWEEVTRDSINQYMANGISEDDALISSLSALEAPLETNLEKLDPSNTMSDLISSLNGLSTGDTISAGSAPTVNTEGTSGPSALDELLTMIKEQIEVDSGLESTNGDSEQKKLSTLQVLQIEDSQTATFHSLSSQLNTEATNVGTQRFENQSAITQVSSSKRFSEQLGYNSSYKQYDQQKAALVVLKELKVAIKNAENDLTQVAADIVEKAFDSVMYAMSSIMTDVQKVLSDTHLTSKEKEVELTKLLQLVLGFLQTFIQIAENLRSQSKKKIEQANIEAQKTNLNNIKLDSEKFQKIQAEQHALGILGKVMKVVEVLATIVFAATGTIGVAIAMIAISACDEFKVTQKFTNYLASKEHSTDGAEATVTGIAVAATLLGGAGIDLLLTRLAASMDLAIETAMENCKEFIETAVSKVANALDKDAAKTLVEDTAVKTAKEAAKTAAKQFYKEMSAVRAIEYAVKRAVATLQGGAASSKEFEKFVINAVEGSIKRAVSEVTETASSTVVTPEAIRAIAEKAASQILKKAMQDGAKAATDSPRFAAFKDALAKASGKIPENLKSALWAGVFTSGSANLFGGIATSEQNKHHDMSQKDFQIFMETAIEIIQMLAESIAMLKGGGFLDMMKSDEPSAVVSGMLRGGATMQVGGQAVTAGSSFTEGAIDKENAQATQNLEETQAYNNMLRFYMQQNNGTANESTSGLSLEEKRLFQEQVWLSSHVWDGVNAGCKVLAAQSI